MVASINKPADIAEVCSNGNAHKSHDGKNGVIEMSFVPSAEGQLAKKLVRKMFAIHGAEECVGPPPACPKEKALRAEVNAMRAELGKPRVRY